MIYDIAKLQISNSIELLDINEIEKEKLKEILSYPNKIIEVNIPILMDNWDIKNFIGYRSQHNNTKWPYKGWLRFHPDVNVEEVKALSMWMSIKTSVLDLPLGGGKGWIICNPKELSNNELEKISRWFVNAIYKNIWPNIDIPAPDVNTNWQTMAWMMDEYSKLVWEYTPWSFTGKPLELGGSLWREEATWFWWIKVLETYFNKKEDTYSYSLEWKSIVIQWFWNVWYFAALRLLERGANIISISDSNNAILSKEKKWFSNDEILTFIKEKRNNRKKLIDIAKENNIDIIKISNKEILELEVNILILAALENVIDKNNASKIKAKTILELANGPITPEADTILEKNNIVVIPDVLANAWGVCVSYFEQVQNKQTFYWDKDEIIDKMDKILEKETKSILEDDNTISLRKRAYKKSLYRIYQAMKLKGQI